MAICASLRRGAGLRATIRSSIFHTEKNSTLYHTDWYMAGCEVDFVLSVPGQAQGGSVDRKHRLGRIGGKWSVGRVGFAKNSWKPIETAKNHLPTLFCGSKRVGRSGCPPQNFLRRAAGRSVGRTESETRYTRLRESAEIDAKIEINFAPPIGLHNTNKMLAFWRVRCPFVLSKILCNDEWPFMSASRQTL